MLCDHNRGQGHLRLPGEKRSSKKFCDLEVLYRVRHKDLPMINNYPVTTFFKLETPNFAECLLHIQGVRAKFDTFCLHYISELLQDIDIG